MSVQKKKTNEQILSELIEESNFISNVFSVVIIPPEMKGENEDLEFEIVKESEENPPEAEEKRLQKEKRARSLAELEDKLEIIKSQHNFNLKSKVAKKSLRSILNKKIKKRDKLKKTKVSLAAKPVFNKDGKLVFSKFDFVKRC